MNEDLAKKLNKLMEDIVETEKPIPYLGWWWRDIEDADRLPMSLPPMHDFYWLDNAGKWDYPGRYLDADDSRRVLEAMIKVAEAHIEMTTLLKTITQRKEE